MTRSDARKRLTEDPDPAVADWKWAVEELRQRCDRALDTLHDLADGAKAHGERARLQSKAEGVDLVRSYIQEMFR